MTQADSILARFGGPRRLVAALARLADTTGDESKRRNPATVYKWTYPRDKGGTGGYIPSSAWEDVRQAARLEGILLKPEDWFPEP